MTRSIPIAPVRKFIIVNASAARAFAAFTTGIDRWWPKSHGIGRAPVRQSFIEPFVSGRWYALCEDGSEAVVGHVRLWDPPARLIVSWEIGADWSSDSRQEFTSEVEVRFLAESPGRTRVELEHRDFERMGAEPGARMRGDVDRGWPGLLDLFGGAVSGASPPPSADAFVIHSVPGSPYGRAVLMALEEKAAPWRLAPVAPGTLRGPEHLARHPFGRIPILDHGGFRLYETQAILRYLDRVWPTPLLTPHDPRAAARMDQLMNINDWYLFQGVGNVIAFQRVVGPRLMGLVPDEAAIEAAMPRAEMVFAELARLLDSQPFLAGDALTLADVLLAPQLDFLAHAPEWERLTGQRPNLRRWLAAMRARPSMESTTWERVAELAATG